MGKICLIRHGETDWNRQRILQGQTDIDLNDIGKKQVLDACAFLKDTLWDIIISSPLKRAATSADIIAGSIGVEGIIYDNRLKEQSYGDAEGLSRDERLKRYTTRPFPGEEPREAFVDRVMKFIYEIAEKHRDKNVVVVSHGGAINAVLHIISGGEIGCGKTRLRNACVNMIENKNSGFKITYYNRMYGVADEN